MGSDRDAFRDLYQAEYAHVFAVTYAFCGDRDVAQDATQEAFSRALARWRRVQNQTWVVGWIITTALNLTRRWAGRSKREAASGSAPTNAAVDDSVAPIGADVTRALRELPPRQREAAFLYYLADCSVSRVADVMDVSEGAVKAHLARARQKLKGILDVPLEPTGKEA